MSYFNHAYRKSFLSTKATQSATPGVQAGVQSGFLTSSGIHSRYLSSTAAPNKLGSVIGIFKAYCTRVGGGPFPTELDNEVGEELRRIGHEFGATTGRPRRCGWIDLPALKYAIMLNGVTELVMTKADVLSGFEKIYACTHYEYNGETIDYMPYDILSIEAKPVYQEIDGWKEDLTQIHEIHEIPAKLMAYIKYLEKELEVPVKYLSVGPDRTQTLILS